MTAHDGARADVRKRHEAEEATHAPASNSPSPNPDPSATATPVGPQIANLDVEAIRARMRRAVAVATEGPWFNSCGGLYVYGATPGDEVARFKRRTDSDFALAARELVPPLLAELDRLTAALAAERARVARVEALLSDAERLTALSTATDFEGNRWETPIPQANLRAALTTTTAAPTTESEEDA